MAIQVQELIDKIKNEGVQAAQDEATRILAGARAEAEAIVAEAESRAKDLSRRAQEAITRDQGAGKEALVHAARDAILQLGKDMQRVLDRVVSREVKAGYDEAALKRIVPGLVASWKDSGSGGLTVLLSPQDLAALEAFFAEKLKAELSTGGLELASGADIKSGFKIVERYGSAYFDFSSDALAELISSHLNPGLAEIVRTAARER
jgi:V/A-type H+/Na+-transporting ATPase subunit E